jgi:mono/diheme cytochrome c family protein
MQVTNEDTARTTIQNGGVRMPGFQHALNPSQISAIIAFLKTLDSPPDRIVVGAPDAP